MAENQYTNKVVLSSGETLIDLTGVWVKQTDTTALKNEMKLGKYICQMEG